MTLDEKLVFTCLANCEISTYTTMYCPERAIASIKDIAESCKITRYRTQNAIKSLVEKGLVERASCGRPAIASCGEYTELVCEAMPPLNGFALTKKAFDECIEWKDIYNKWLKSMAEWANAKEGENNVDFNE